MILSLSLWFICYKVGSMARYMIQRHRISQKKNIVTVSSRIEVLARICQSSLFGFHFHLKSPWLLVFMCCQLPSIALGPHSSQGYQ